HSAGDAGNRRRSVCGLEVRRGESGDQSARAAERRRQGAGSAGSEEDDRGNCFDTVRSLETVVKEHAFCPDYFVLNINFPRHNCKSAIRKRAASVLTKDGSFN